MEMGGFSGQLFSLQWMRKFEHRNTYLDSIPPWVMSVFLNKMQRKGKEVEIEAAERGLYSSISR
jgi:hypothetical protein